MIIYPQNLCGPHFANLLKRYPKSLNDNDWEVTPPLTVISTIKCAKGFHVLEESCVWVINAWCFWSRWRAHWFWFYNSWPKCHRNCFRGWHWHCWHKWFWFCFGHCGLPSHPHRCRNLVKTMIQTILEQLHVKRDHNINKLCHFKWSEQPI